jgi:hypothetical protein
MIDYKKANSLPAALRNKVIYEEKLITKKEMIDDVILVKKLIDVKQLDSYKQKPYVIYDHSGHRFTFVSKAEKKYIDYLIKKINEGGQTELEHKATIKKIQTELPSTTKAAKYIAADHIQETPDYYRKLEMGVLKQGGPIQELKDGTVLKGPSHDNGGIEIVVNNKPVAEAEGGEVVINAENSKEYCHELSEINQRDGNGKPLDCGCAGEQTDKMEHGGEIKLNNVDLEFDEMARGGLIGGHVIEKGSILYDYFDEIKAELYSQFKDKIYRIDEEKQYSSPTGRLFVFTKSGTGYYEIEKYLKDNFGINSKIDTIFNGGYKGLAINGNNYMARGGSINKRMKFPKNDKSQDGKYGSVKSEPQKSDYQKNKEIEQLIDQKGDDPNNYLFSEKQFLREYSGYGGIDVEEFGSIEEAKKALTEFYTPDAIIRKMWALAYKFGFKDGQSVLEPSVGTGEFLKYVPTQSMATGYEINKYSYTICKILYPQFNFYLQPFENIFIKNRDTVKNKLSDIQKFDLVIGNPPYGDVSGLGMGMGEKQYTNAKNWIEYFILRGLDLTLPNGLLIYIIGTEVANGGTPFLQQGNSKIKQMIADKADLVDAYRLPNGVFDRTDVLSDILVFKRK